MDEALDKTAEWIAHRNTVESLMIDNRPWGRVLEISYEQLLENENVLFDLMPLDKTNIYDPTMYTGSERSPYDKKKVIYRYEAERFRFYKELEKYHV